MIKIRDSLPTKSWTTQRNVGGRLGLQHGLGGLVAPDHAGYSDMVGGRGPALRALAPPSGIHTYPISLSILILHTYPNDPSYIPQLCYMLIPTNLHILSFIPIIHYMPM